MDEFHARIGETPHTWVEWASSQLLQNTPLHPIAEWGRIRFGGADVALERRLAELEGTLSQMKLDPGEIVPLLAPLLEIPLPEDSAPKLAPEELRRHQLAALVAWILAGARTQPIVLAFEDLHWADPTSLDLMKTLAEGGATAPLLIVATMRPEFRAPWTTRSHHGVMSLVPLDRAQIREMVEAIAERHALSQEVVKGITDRTGGVPLFVEEVTRLLLERGVQGGAQAIPPTLQQSLAARLDRLGQSREVAQIGAVLGRELFNSALAPLIRRSRGQTFGVVGFGRIGTATALRAKAFGFSVVGFDPYVSAGTEIAIGIERVSALDALLDVADVVSLHCPLTSETKGMINAEALRRMKSNAILINTARGAIVDVAALIAAIRHGEIAGAGIDVLPAEPPHPNDEIAVAYRNLKAAGIADRLILTPHAA